MCCFLTSLVLLGPRFGALIWWLIQPGRWAAAFNSNWIWPILGVIFLPWTTIIYVLIAPGGVVGLDWLWIILAVVADIASYGGGAFGNRDRVGM